MTVSADTRRRPPKPRRAPKLYKKGGWYYTVFYDPARRPVRKWFALQTDRKRHADKLFQQLDEAYMAGTFDPWRDAAAKALGVTYVTLDQAVEKYHDEKLAAGDWRPKTARWKKDTLGRFVLSVPRGIGPAHVRPADVAAFVDARPDEGAHHKKDPTGQTRTAQTRRTYLAAVRNFFAWCALAGYADENPAVEVKPAKAPRGVPVEHLRPEQYAKLVEAVHKDADVKRARRRLNGPHAAQIVWAADVFDVAVMTGLRLGELHRLRWADVDLASRTVYVRDTERGRTKTEASVRDVPMVNAAAEVFERLHAARPTENARDPVLLSPDRHGGPRPISTQNASRLFRHYAKEAGLPAELHFHSLRKTFASWLASAGVPMHVIQRALGHATLRTTTDTYAGVWDSTVRSEMSRGFAAAWPAPDGSAEG